MNKKTVIQKLNQLKDVLVGLDREDLEKDILDLKYSQEDIDYLKFKNKWLNK